MPNRYQSKQRKELYETIALYEGEYCLVCFARGAGRRGPPSVKLEIDHALNERHLTCKTHNLELRRLSLEEHAILMARYSAENEREREKSGEWLSVVKRAVDYSEGSAEMEAHSIIKSRWDDFMRVEMKPEGAMTKNKAIYGGAKYSGGSPVTTTRYLKTECLSDDGLYREITQNGEKIIVYRNGVKPDRKGRK